MIVINISLDRIFFDKARNRRYIFCLYEIIQGYFSFERKRLLGICCRFHSQDNPRYMIMNILESSVRTTANSIPYFTHPERLIHIVCLQRYVLFNPGSSVLKMVWPSWHKV